MVAWLEPSLANVCLARYVPRCAQVVSKPLVDAGCVRWGQKVTSVEQDPAGGPTTLCFADGSKETFDIVIGADGTNSVTSASIAPEVEKETAFASATVWYGTIHTQTFDHPLTNDGGTNLMMFVGAGVATGYRGHSMPARPASADRAKISPYTAAIPLA